MSGPTRLVLLVAGLWLAAAPWPWDGRPHLYGKLEWLWVNGGDHMRPVDIFDLFFHLAWALVALWALFGARNKAPSAAQPG